MTVKMGVRKEDIAVFALYQLGGAANAVHIEDIAYECLQLAKAQFSWQLEKYQEFPDIKAVYYALDAVSRDKPVQFVRKSADRSKGGQYYQLTPLGAKWIKENRARLAAHTNTEGQSGEQNKDVQKNLAQSKRQNEAFVRFVKKGATSTFSIYELIDFLGCSLDTSPTAVRKKFDDMQTKANLVGDADVKSFLDVAKQKFPDVLSV